MYMNPLPPIFETPPPSNLQYSPRNPGFALNHIEFLPAYPLGRG